MLNKKEIKQLVECRGALPGASGDGVLPLIESYINIDKQLNPNGFDITVGKIFEFGSRGSLDFSNSERVVPQGKELEPVKKSPEDKYGWWELKEGSYKVRTNETVNLPNNLAALGFTRTSVLRMGALTQNGVWDAGFKGRGEFILTVGNPFGIKIKQNARIVQLVFYRVEETEEYNGIYKHLE